MKENTTKQKTVNKTFFLIDKRDETIQCFSSKEELINHIAEDDCIYDDIDNQGKLKDFYVIAQDECKEVFIKKEILVALL